MNQAEKSAVDSLSEAVKKSEPRINLGRIIKKLSVFLRHRLSLEDDNADPADTIEYIKKGVEFKETNILTLIFVILIASIGLNMNSAAVIIGAMLISPLMGPIMGVGMGVGTNDFVLIKKLPRTWESWLGFL